MVNLIVFLKAKDYHFKVLLKRTRGLVLNEKFLFRIFAFGIFRIISKLRTFERVYRRMGAEKDNVSLNYLPCPCILHTRANCKFRPNCLILMLTHIEFHQSSTHSYWKFESLIKVTCFRNPKCQFSIWPFATKSFPLITLFAQTIKVEKHYLKTHFHTNV